MRDPKKKAVEVVWRLFIIHISLLQIYYIATLLKVNSYMVNFTGSVLDQEQDFFGLVIPF